MEDKQMKKTLLCLAVALMLCLAVFPAEAHAEGSSCNIYVGDTEITTDNASDVFGDGKVSYDQTTNTLTLDNYTYTGQGRKYSNEFWGMTVGRGITIELKGENSIQLTAADSKCKSYGIYISTYDDVMFKGSGSLVLRGGDITEGTSTSYESGGIRAPWGDVVFGNEFTGSVTAKGGNVSGSGITYGFYTISELSVYNGKLVAIGGEHSGTGEIISCGYYGGDTINIYGGEVSFFGGNVSSTDNQAHSYGIAHSYYSPTVNIFDGILIAQGGNATGNDYVYSIGMESGTLNAYGGITIAQGGDASKNDTTDFNRLRSYGLGADVNAVGGAVVARAGTVNGGFRVTTKRTSKTKENNRFAISYLKLGSGSVIAKAAGWSDPAGASGFGDLTVTSDHSTGKFIEGTVGGVSNYKPALEYNYDVAPWPTGIVIVPSGWTQAAGPGTPSADSYFVEINSSDPSGSTLDLGAYSLLSTNLYEGTGSVIPTPALTVSGASYTVTDYTVAVTLGAHMSSTGSGALSQTGIALTDIVITADEGYYFPQDYLDKLSK